MNLTLSKCNYSYVRKFVIAAMLLVLLPLFLTFSNSIVVLQSSVEAQSRREPPAARSSQMLSRAVYQRLEEIMELRDEGDLAGADEVLLELRVMYDRGRLNSAETLRLWQFYANFAALEENYVDAIIYQELILGMDEDALTPEARESALLLLGQLNYAVEDYYGAIDAYLRYLDIALEQDIKVYQRISIAYYTMEEYTNALPYILEYMDQTRAQGEQVDKNTYELARSLYLLLEDYVNTLQITREMIVIFREPSDWELMANILGAMERFEEQAGFLYAMNTFGFVDNEGQILNLSGQLFNAEYYWGAAKILNQGLESGLLDSEEDSWSRLAQSYQIAREDEMAIEPFILAAEISDRGEMYSLHKETRPVLQIAPWHLVYLPSIPNPMVP